MNSWFTVKVKYTKQLEDGTFKRVSEPYLLAAMTFTDAEARIYEELGSIIRGEFLVTDISRTDVHDIFHYEDADTWYKCIITYEAGGDGGEEGAKAKKVSQTFLVTAHSVKDAYERLKESLGGMMIDYNIKSVVLSPLVDVFPFGDDEEKQKVLQENGIFLPKVLADMIGNTEYRKELTDKQRQFAKDNQLVVVYGASDDLTIIDGVLDNELQNGKYWFNSGSEFIDDDDVSENEKFGLNFIETDYHPFSVSTDIPHAKFKVMEDDDEYGIGIIFSIRDLK